MRIESVLGDITRQQVDVIVNAANSSLLGGGGVDGAIHAAAGPELLAACRELRRTSLPDGLPPGHAVATDAFALPARWVVHTVGPNWHAGERDTPMLVSCFLSSLEVAVGLGARSIAFPAISAGAYGWDVRAVAHGAASAVRAWAGSTAQDEGGIDLVRFVLSSPAALTAFEDELAA